VPRRRYDKESLATKKSKKKSVRVGRAGRAKRLPAMALEKWAASDGSTAGALSAAAAAAAAAAAGAGALRASSGAAASPVVATAAAATVAAAFATEVLHLLLVLVRRGLLPWRGRGRRAHPRRRTHCRTRHCHSRGACARKEACRCAGHDGPSAAPAASQHTGPLVGAERESGEQGEERNMRRRVALANAHTCHAEKPAGASQTARTGPKRHVMSMVSQLWRQNENFAISAVKFTRSLGLTD